MHPPTAAIPASARHSVPSSRLPTVGLRAALALTVSAGALVAQDSKVSPARRPTVPVVSVANVAATPAPTRGKPVPGKPGAKTTAARPAAPKPGTAAKPSAVPTSAKPVASRPAAAAPRVGGQVPVVRPASVRTVAASTTRADTSAGDLGAPAAASDARFTRYRSVRDSVAGEAARAAAGRSQKLRVIVHLDARELAVLDGADTLLVAPVAIGRDTTIRYGTRTWSFDTPRGVRTVRRKNENPVWVPPDWHYVEVAARKKLKLAYLTPGRGVSVGGGEQLVVRGGVVGLQAGKSFTPLPTDEEIVFGNTLYVPPLGTKNRQIEGELGRFRLDMGDGYQLHGTPHEDTIGDAATHGCIRLYDEDIEWLYQHVPLGTSVYIF